MMTTTVEAGRDMVRITNAVAALEVATQFGPRITSYRLISGSNVLVELPLASLDWRPGRSFMMYGGHRLWLAPEEPSRTYEPDDTPVEVTEYQGEVTLTGGVSQVDECVKSMSVALESATTAVTVRHRIENRGSAPTTLAPWAITMLRPEGSLVLPLAPDTGESHQANRSIVLWPYTRLNDPLIELGDRAIVLRPGRSDPTKIGTGGGAGWGAYVVDDTVFTKRALYLTHQPYPDLGAAIQGYAKDDFCELETLGPLTTLDPGHAVEHVEEWRLQRVTDLAEGSELAETLQSCGLATSMT